MDQVAHDETSKEDRHHMRLHEAEGVDSEDEATLHVVSENANKSTGDHNEDVGESSNKLGVHTKHTHSHEDAGLPHEKVASHGCIHDDGHTGITSDSPNSACAHAKHTSHESAVGVTNELTANTEVHGTHIHDNGGTEFMQGSREKPTTCDKHLNDVGHAGIALGDNAHGKHINVQDVQVLSGTGERLMAHGKQHANTDVGPSSAEPKHRLDAEEGNMSNTLEEKSPRHEKLVHEGDIAGENHEHRHKQEKHSDDARETVVSQEHGEKCLDDDCESKRAFSDENSPRERVHFSRGSTPDVDTPTQRARHPKIKAGGKGVGSTERGPGSTDGNPETPSTSWAFSARASIAPSKFDHMATLRMTYGVYKESNKRKEGAPLSLLPEILESARFMVPPPRDLVPLLQRIDPEYKSGDLVRWSLLQSLALQIERKEARYPSVFIPRCSVARPSSSSPNSWKAVQRSPSRRTHPEDDRPELEPQVYEMMKEIDNHRRKSAKEGNYLAADAAAQRLLELKLFEDNKRRATMLERHAQEREQAEKAYKEELQERNQLWDERLKNFQKEVVDHAQHLKQQHIAALQHFKEKIASKTPVKAQWSRELLKQRRIQIYLGKQGKYLEAQEVKQSADRMEQAELQAAIAAFQAEVIGKEQTVRVKQQTEMDILLQRAARTREEIRKSRTLDLQRCHQRHKNVMRELAAIQKQEVFRFDQLMQKKVQNPYTGVGFGSQRVSQSPPRSHANALDYSTDDALYSGGEDSSMKD